MLSENYCLLLLKNLNLPLQPWYWTLNCLPSNAVCGIWKLDDFLRTAWYQAGPDTINHFVLALNMVYLVAVAMMTLQHISVVLQHKVLCEQGMRGETERRRDRGGWDSGRIKWGQLLLKDEPRSQSCLCHMILILTRRRVDFREGERFGERKSGKCWSICVKKNRKRRTGGDQRKINEERWEMSRWYHTGAPAVLWNGTQFNFFSSDILLYPLLYCQDSPFYQTPTSVSNQLVLIAPVFLPSLFL